VQQLREAFPWDQTRRYLVRDRDHVIVFSTTGLQRLLHLYRDYYERARTHLSLAKDTPIPRAIAPPREGTVVAIPQVRRLHHR
jgi:hypothetical protein